ncbi:hypothetical protein VZC37_12285 [Gordonia sp. LSe1-13]|uniref:Uncharacterized protein n=1 Tax=Gordonia sesuvii TaxID=3116777 RepID=A0ABU7MDD4_9ACTN|nr:hypothetical protein [Gordonia sp. LSe1-13]
MRRRSEFLADGTHFRADGISFRADGILFRADGISFRADGISFHADRTPNSADRIQRVLFASAWMYGWILSAKFWVLSAAVLGTLGGGVPRCWARWEVACRRAGRVGRWRAAVLGALGGDVPPCWARRRGEVRA